MTTFISRAIAAVRRAGEIRPEERAVAGHAGAVVWGIASVSVIAMAVALPAAQVHRDVLIAMGLGGCAWSAVSGLLLDYRRLPDWLIHLSTLAGVVSIAVAISLSGGGRSPAWACFFYVVVYAAYFFKPPAAAAYLLACVAADAAALVAGTAGRGAEGTATLVIAAPAFVVLGVAIVVGKRLGYRVRRQAESLAAEQGALRRVATAVVSGEPADRFYQLVAVEAGQLLSAGGAAILRLEADDQATILGAWALSDNRVYRVGDSFAVAPDSGLARGLAAARPVRVEQVATQSSLGRLGYGSSLVAPIQVKTRIWGFLAVASVGARSFEPEHERRLTEFARLISTAVTNIEDRAALAAQASTDALTGVANHRAFYERLAADMARARRHGSPLSVAMIDVDRFKLVNDAGGHEAGDEMLVRVAQCLSSATRAEDMLARVGGDEFAWILPETTGEAAVQAVERARVAMAESPTQQPRATLSAGVCDTRHTADPAELVRLADRALYSSKEHGRDQVRLYAPASTDELAAT
ncbi:MAG TPA: sensor domain-containing diguanylate cyclase [Solirubrobacteraceae bacterium]|jgi:diguanylate cyclase (GGDEF)-like protein